MLAVVIRWSSNDKTECLRHQTYASTSLCFLPVFRDPKENIFDNIGRSFRSKTHLPHNNVRRHRVKKDEREKRLRVTWRSKTRFDRTWLVKTWREKFTVIWLVAKSTHRNCSSLVTSAWFRALASIFSKLGHFNSFCDRFTDIRDSFTDAFY